MKAAVRPSFSDCLSCLLRELLASVVCRSTPCALLDRPHKLRPPGHLQHHAPNLRRQGRELCQHHRGHRGELCQRVRADHQRATRNALVLRYTTRGQLGVSWRQPKPLERVRSKNAVRPARPCKLAYSLRGPSNPHIVAGRACLIARESWMSMMTFLVASYTYYQDWR